jgi:hypothetical protein
MGGIPAVGNKIGNVHWFLVSGSIVTCLGVIYKSWKVFMSRLVTFINVQIRIWNGKSGSNCGKCIKSFAIFMHWICSAIAHYLTAVLFSYWRYSCSDFLGLLSLHNKIQGWSLLLHDLWWERIVTWLFMNEALAMLGIWRCDSIAFDIIYCEDYSLWTFLDRQIGVLIWCVGLVLE